MDDLNSTTKNWGSVIGASNVSISNTKSTGVKGDNRRSNTDNDVQDEVGKVVIDKTLPPDLDRQVPQKEELYGQEALLAEAGIDKNGYMRLDEDAVLDLNSPKLQVIKTLPNGKKVIMSVEEYNREKYMKDVTDEELAALDEKLKNSAKSNTNNAKVESETTSENIAEDVATQSTVGDSNQVAQIDSENTNKGNTDITTETNPTSPKDIFTTKDIPDASESTVKDAIPDVSNVDVFAVDSVAGEGLNNDATVNLSGANESEQVEVKSYKINQGNAHHAHADTMDSIKAPSNDLDEGAQGQQDYKHIPGTADNWDYLRYEDDPEGVPHIQPTEILDPSLSKYKILIIEDNSDVRYQYEFVLKREGFTVITASNGEEGIVKAIKERPQLILLDILMPEVDGWEVLKALRQYTLTYKPRIMIISNLGAPEDIQKAYNLGADMFIIKSDTTLQQVVEKVKRILQSAEANKEQPLLIPLPKSPEISMFLKQNMPELAQGVCPECGGPLGLKLVPQHHKDPETGKVTLDFNARIVCLRCGKEWV